MGNRNITLWFLTLAILLVSTSGVLAFGISSPYWKDYPLEMLPGQMKEISFNLQNCPSLKETCVKEDVNIIASFEEGEEIAEIISGSEYNIQFGTADTNMVLRISIPQEATIGDSYNIRFSIASPPREEEGNIQLKLKYSVDFPVVIVGESAVQSTPTTQIEEPETKLGTVTVTILIIAAVLLIIFIILLKRKKIM